MRAPLLFFDHSPDILPPRVGVSACLAGQAVRYDGDTRLHPPISQWIAPYVYLAPLCPEVMAGLGVPRPPVQLIRLDHQLRARGVENTALDVTQDLLNAFPNIMAESGAHCYGYILKSKSPSCGVGTTPIYLENGALLNYGNGVFAEQLMVSQPLCALADERQLISEHACYLFLLRVWARLDILHASVLQETILQGALVENWQALKQHYCNELAEAGEACDREVQTPYELIRFIDKVFIRAVEN